MKISWSRGPIPPVLSEVLATVHPVAAEDASDFHRCVETLLRRANFSVRREYPMPYRGRAGRIDLHAHRPDTGRIWLELDRCRPRAKSIIKLNLAIDRFGGSAAVVCRVPPKRKN